MTDPKHHIFVSYSRTDVLWCRRIVDSLTRMAGERDIDVFVDKDIAPGENWQSELRQAMARTPIALFLVSKAWKRSKACRAELRLSFEKASSDGAHRMVWASLDGSQTSELASIQAALNPTTPLMGLRDDAAIESLVGEICHNVLNQLDPTWGKLQARLPRKYRLLRRMGGGSTSAVYLANDRSLGRRVTIRAALGRALNAEFDEVVHRAAKIAPHPALPTVYGAWLDGDPHYCVLDYVEGRSLRSSMDQPTVHWDACDAIRLTLRAGEALGHAIACGVRYRELLPSKILVNDTGDAFICGLAKPAGAVGGALLRRAKSFGRALTPEQTYYLVPEHCYPLPDLDGKAEQYLLGLIVYEMLTRELPRTLENPVAVEQGEDPQFIPLAPLYQRSETVPGCPRLLSDVVMKMVSVDPRDRWPHLSDALEVLRELEPLVDLTLARDSYVRCMSRPDLEESFFRSFYASFQKRRPAAVRLFERFTSGDWNRQYVLVKEAGLLLFAFAAAPGSARTEPNVLSRLAALHGPAGLNVEHSWYDDFADALVETACTVDPECDAQAQPFIAQAWRCSVGPGIRYMKSHGDPQPSVQRG
jgi:serine/threonine protein kinase